MFLFFFGLWFFLHLILSLFSYKVKIIKSRRNTEHPEIRRRSIRKLFSRSNLQFGKYLFTCSLPDRQSKCAFQIYYTGFRVQHAFCAWISVLAFGMHQREEKALGIKYRKIYINAIHHAVSFYCFISSIYSALNHSVNLDFPHNLSANIIRDLSDFSQSKSTTRV